MQRELTTGADSVNKADRENANKILKTKKQIPK